MMDDGQRTRPTLQGPDVERDKLRSLVATVDRKIAALAPSDGLQGSWAELVELLGLGPAPDVRECPNCNRSAMRTATLCGYCWTRLPSLASAQDLARGPSSASER